MPSSFLLLYDTCVIDSHCHLAGLEFAEDLDAVLERARAAGVERIICIGETLEESGKELRLAEKHDNVFCTVGVHPHHASLVTLAPPARATRDDSWLDRLRSLVHSSKKVKGIGEIGLDYHYDYSPRDVQQSVFREQLLLARELHLPVVVHCREAVDDVWTIVDDLKPERIVIHCCSEKWSDVERFVERGYLLSFTGIATFPKSEDIRETIRRCPLSHLMVETDAPFLAPVPYRGKRNEPAYVMEVAKKVAEIKGLSLQEVDEVTTKNAVEFFGLPS